MRFCFDTNHEVEETKAPNTDSILTIQIVAENCWDGETFIPNTHIPKYPIGPNEAMGTTFAG